jgi:hypothetical protein
MNIIYKYDLQEAKKQSVFLPKNSKLLSIREQNNKLQMWFMIDTKESEEEENVFYIFGTGFPALDDMENLQFIDTVLMSSGLVWHIFKEEKK